MNLLCRIKPSREKQKLHNLTYIKNLKKENKFEVHRYEREQMGGCQRVGEKDGKWVKEEQRLTFPVIKE